MQIKPNFINGEWIETKEFSTNINPSNLNETVGLFSKSSESDIEAAISAAKNAQREWSNTPPFKRAETLKLIANMLRESQAVIAETLAREEGKTYREALGEIARAIATFEYFSHILQMPTGTIYSSQRPGASIHTREKPVGVVAIITPWNFPIAVPAWKIAPALAYGNAVVFKPAETVSASAWALTEIISRAGVPAGVFNLVMGSGRRFGGIIAGHPDINAITFTGSTEVGSKLLQDTHSKSNARVQTEMGGKNGILILDDANLEVALSSVIDSAFGSTGQRCTASSRIIVTSGIHDRFLDLLVESVNALRVGDALSESTQMGPVANSSQLATDLDYIEIGKSEGAQLVAGGDLVKSSTPGHFLAPTLFADGSSTMRINQEEIFGPVACVIEARDVDHGIEILNETNYGLSAGVITDSLEASEHFQNFVEAGLVSVNTSPAISEHHVPFGGIKESGYGPREQGVSAKEFFTVQSTHFVQSQIV